MSISEADNSKPQKEKTIITVQEHTQQKSELLYLLVLAVIVIAEATWAE